jgi:hypothetical protein
MSQRKKKPAPDAPPEFHTSVAEWLNEELCKVIGLLAEKGKETPAEKDGNPIYAAGLYDMAVWIQDKLVSDIEWQALREMVGPEVAAQMPLHQSEFMAKPPEEKAAASESL